MTEHHPGEASIGDLEYIHELAIKNTMEREMSEFADWMGESRLIFTRAQADDHLSGMLDRYMERFGVREDG